MVGAPSTSILKIKLQRQIEAEAATGDRFFPDEDPQPQQLPPPASSADPAEDDYDDPDGTLFSGEGARSVPTSTSTFRMRARSRGELDRWSRDLSRSRSEAADRDRSDTKSIGASSSRSKSGKGKKRRSSSRRPSDATTTGGETDDGEGTDAQSLASSRRRSSRRQSESEGTGHGRPSSQHRRKSSRTAPSESSDDELASDRPTSGFLRGLSDALRGRAPSLGRNDSSVSIASRPGSVSRRPKIRRRSSDRSQITIDDDAISARSESEEEEGQEDDPYGPYGSSDTTSTNTSHSSSSQEDGPRPRRGGGSTFLPGVGDFFGESRIDFEGISDDEDFSDAEGSPGKRRSPNAYQALYIPDEDLPLKLQGLKVRPVRAIIWAIGCFLSLGSLWLLGRWVPSIWLRFVGTEGEFAEASYIVVTVSCALFSFIGPNSN